MKREMTDLRIRSMLKAIAEVVSKEMPGAGFILIIGRSSGDMMSLSNLDQDDTELVLETILTRRRGDRDGAPHNTTTH